MKQEKDQKRKKKNDDEITRPGEQTTKHTPMGQQPMKGNNPRPMDIEDEEEDEQTDQRKRA